MLRNLGGLLIRLKQWRMRYSCRGLPTRNGDHSAMPPDNRPYGRQVLQPAGWSSRVSTWCSLTSHCPLLKHLRLCHPRCLSPPTFIVVISLAALFSSIPVTCPYQNGVSACFMAIGLTIASLLNFLVSDSVLRVRLESILAPSSR